MGNYNHIWCSVFGGEALAEVKEGPRRTRLEKQQVHDNSNSLW